MTRDIGDVPVIVFDIGGTWFRSGVATGGGVLMHYAKERARNYKNTAYRKIRDLQGELVEYLMREVNRLREYCPGKQPPASISMGAAVNGFTGEILNSGPLWGPESRPFQLMEELSKRDGSVDWYIVNDVTAALLRHVCDPAYVTYKTVSLVTVSSGIALRTIRVRSLEVPLDPVSGLQGEIGHLPACYQFLGTTVSLNCDCGGECHLNAFSSGRGLEALLPKVAGIHSMEFEKSVVSSMVAGDAEQLTVGHLMEGLRKNDTWAQEFLDSVALPLARELLTLFSINPEIDCVVLTGGVVHGLAPFYMESVVRTLEQYGLYQTTERMPTYFRQKMKVGFDDDLSGLLGAGTYARQRRGPNPDSGRGETWNVTAQLTVSYDVIPTNGLLDPSNEGLIAKGAQNSLERSPRRLAFVDANVMKYHGDLIARYFEEKSPGHKLVLVTCSEESKNMQNVLALVREIDEFRLMRRSEPIIGIGGGVLLDMVGLAASLYRRGTPYIRVPTTLLAMVDASVGAKTGVNFGSRKNRVGSYFPPLATFIDKMFLMTQDDRSLANGVGEIIKLGVIAERRLFELLEANSAELKSTRFQTGEASANVIALSIEVMLGELQDNLWEEKLERFVDFGHSFSHRLELEASPEVMHGEAVCIDIALSAAISHGRGQMDERSLDRIFALLREWGLPAYHDYCTPEHLWETLTETVRHRNGRQRLPLPVGIGKATFCNDVTIEEIAQAVNLLKTKSETD